MAEHHQAHMTTVVLPHQSQLARILISHPVGKESSQVTTEAAAAKRPPKNPSYAEREEMARLLRDKTPEEVAAIVHRKIETVVKYRDWGPAARETARKQRSRPRASKVRIIVPATPEQRDRVTAGHPGARTTPAAAPVTPPVATTPLRDRLLAEAARLTGQSQALLDQAAALADRARELTDIANGKTDIGELLVRLLAKEYGLAEGG
jgi:hypothetical protein